MILTGRLVVGAVTCLGFLALGATTLEHRSRPGALPFGFLCLLLAVFSLLVAPPEAVLGNSLLVRIVTFELIIVAWLLFAVTYTGRGPVASTRLLLGLAGLLMLVILGIKATSVVSAEAVGLLFATNYIVQSFTSALGVYGLLIAVRSAVVYDDLPPGGSRLLMIFGVGFVCLAVLITAISSASARVTLDALLVVSSLIALSSLATVFRYEVFAGAGSAGHLARKQVLDEMDAAVVIVDRAERVLDCNEAFADLFGVSRRRAIGDPLDEVAGPLPTGPRESVTAARGSRVCDIERTAVTAADGTDIGEAYRLRDVTDRQTREQRLDVLNRVLRHNLRNDLDAMHAFAETIETDPEAVEVSEVGARIGDLAAELSDIGSTVARSERLLARDDRDERPVDVCSVADHIVDRLADQYPGTATVHCRDDPVFGTDPELLEAVLYEVVENGLKHGPGPDSRVEIEVTRPSDDLEIAVRDNGPGVPEREQAVLLDGEESPLRHGSGVGLWLVNWGLSRLGGELSFRDRELGGSVVTLTLPDNTSNGHDTPDRPDERVSP